MLGQHQFGPMIVTPSCSAAKAEAKAVYGEAGKGGEGRGRGGEARASEDSTVQTVITDQNEQSCHA